MSNISQKTKDLIDRQCRNVEREDFELDKPGAEELILKTYDLFNLPRPKRVEWCIDIFESKFQKVALSAGSARSALSDLSDLSAGSARSALSALSAGSSWSAGSARLALSAGSAGSARLAWSAWSARSALSAGSARSAGSAGSAGSALDYDFDWFVAEYEYCENRKNNPGNEPNENDYKYLEYCELLMQAKEAGLGYRIEWENTLYLVPTPLVKIDERNRFHSLVESAIKWKGGEEFYYINGINFKKELWEKVVNKTISAQEAIKLENIEQRTIALKILGWDKVLKEIQAKTISTDEYGELIEADLKDHDKPARFLKAVDPSKNETIILRVDPDIKTPKEAQEWSYRLSIVEQPYSPNLRT